MSKGSLFDDDVNKISNPADPDADLDLFSTHDDQYLLKQIKKEEKEKFNEISVNYHNAVKGTATLLTKIVGLYGYTSEGSQEYIIMIMKNVVQVDKMRTVYDLKKLASPRVVNIDRIISNFNLKDYLIFNCVCLIERHPRMRE